jgi:pimeloyl-ACP methyl ester carboxylesterase
MIVDGHELEARWIGDRSRAPVLVFLHEGLGSLSQWRDFPAAISDGAELPALVYSRRGHGQSDPVSLPRPLTYMQDEARHDLPGLLDAAGISRAILIGHSDGASIALVHAALDGGRRVAALALEAPHVFVEDLSITSIRAAREAYEHGDLRARLARHHAHVDVTFRGWNDAWLDPDFRAWNLESYLPRIGVPILVIQGEEDPYGTRAQVDAIAARASGPVETLLLPKCGHAPHRDREAATRDALLSFIQRVTSAQLLGRSSR